VESKPYLLRAPSPGHLDATFHRFIESRSASSRARYRERSRGLLVAPSSLREPLLGRYAALRPDQYRTIGSDGIGRRFDAVAVDPADLARSLEVVRRRLTVRPTLTGVSDLQLEAAPSGRVPLDRLRVDEDLASGLAFKKMRLFVREVRCREETDGVFEGSDEIYLGGTATDPFGSTRLVDDW